MEKDMVKGRDAIEKEAENEQLKIVHIYKRMISKYVEDKFAGNIDIEAFTKELDKINIKFVDMPSDTGGYYSKLGQESIYISNDLENVFRRDGTLTLTGISKIGSILHETSHFFSHEYSSGDKISNFFEEGMADVFSEECINNFLQNASEEELQSLKINPSKVPYVSKSGYIQEANFVRTTLDVIRQTSGRAKEAEFEYILGNKDNFRELCREALGDKYIEILNSQKDDINVGDDASLDYNNNLTNIIKGIGITFKFEQITQDGQVNVYANRSNIIKNAEIEKNFKDKTERFYEEAINAGSFEALMKLKEEIGICNPDLIKRLADSNVYSYIDLIKYISTFDNIDSNRYLYLLDKDKLLSEEFNNVDANSRKTLLNMVMKSEQTDEKNLNVIKKIENAALVQVQEDGVELTDEEKLLTLRCKYLSNSEHKGERLTAMMNILQNKNINIDDFALEFGNLIKGDFEDYLQNYAKADVKGREKLVEFFAGFEGKQYDGEYIDPVSIWYKKQYYTQVYSDLSEIKTIMNLDDEFTQEVYSNGQYSGEGKYIPKQGATLAMLAMVQKDTVLIDVFDKQNVKAIMDISSISTSFPSLSDEQKNTVLDVIEDIKSEPEYMSDLIRIEDYTRSMLAEETNSDITQRKQNILSSIDDKLNEREKPLEDIYRLLNTYEDTLSNSRQHICNVLIDKAYKDIATGTVQDVSMEKLAAIATKAQDKEGAEYIQSTTAKSLTSVMHQKQFTTQGLLDEISSYDPSIKHDTLIQSYLESIGKAEDKTQKDLLTQLDELAKEGIHVANPQYITYQDKDEQERHIILLNGDESIEAYSTNDSALRSNQELLEAQNKRKKGLFSIFKNKKEKEMISKTVVIGEATEENKESQILNIYENGRIEIAAISNDGKYKITSKKDVETSEIGRNAALIPQKEKTQFEVYMADKVVGDNEYQYEVDNKKAPTRDARDDLNI